MTMTEIDDTDVSTPEGSGVKVRFTQRERRGVVLGLIWPQIIIILTGVAFFLVILFAAAHVLWVGLLGALLLIGFGAWSWRQVPAITLVWQSIVYLWRSVRGQTRFRRNVWVRISTTELPTGEPPEMIPVPEVRKAYSLPGGIGDVQFIDIPGRGGFTYNASNRLAAVTVGVDSEPWKLMDAGKKEAAYDGFTSWMSELEGMTGLAEAVIRVRVDRAAATGLTDYAAARDELRETAISDELIAEYNTLVNSASASAMEFSSYVTLVLDTSKLRSEIRDAGGSLAGLGAIISDRVEALESALETCQVKLREWLDAEVLDNLVGTSFDPTTSAERRERFGSSRRQMRSRPPVMAIDENWSTLAVDQSWHQTLWVAEWPRTQARTGFLERLMYAGDSTRCITLQLRPVPLHKAMAEVERAQSDMDASESIRLRFNGRVGVQHRREKADLVRREEELADGFTDVRFRAFVTVSAASEEELRRSRTALQQAAYGSNMTLAILHRQQWAGFVTAALPIGTGKGQGAKS